MYCVSVVVCVWTLLNMYMYACVRSELISFFLHRETGSCSDTQGTASCCSDTDGVFCMVCACATVCLSVCATFCVLRVYLCACVCVHACVSEWVHGVRLYTTCHIYYIPLVHVQVIKNITNVAGCRTAKSKETRGMIEHNSEVYNPPYRDLLPYIHVQWKKICRDDCILHCCVRSSLLFPYFLPFWYPYILLHL